MASDRGHIGSTVTQASETRPLPLSHDCSKSFISWREGQMQQQTDQVKETNAWCLWLVGTGTLDGSLLSVWNALLISLSLSKGHWEFTILLKFLKKNRKKK